MTSQTARVKQRLSPSELAKALPDLLSTPETLEHARKHVARAVETARDQQTWRELHGVVGIVPKALWDTDFDWAFLHARILLGMREAERLVAWVRQVAANFSAVERAALEVFQAWGYLVLEEYQLARALLQQAIPQLEPGLTLGFAWRCLGEANYSLKRPWQQDFHEAHAILQAKGEQRALALSLICYGSCCINQAAHQEGRQALTQALEFLQDDPYHQTWIHSSLATSALGQGELTVAAEHFERVQHLSRRYRSKAFQSRAFCGTGIIQRLQKDWPRARHSFELALGHACDLNDRRQALWNIGQTLRFQGRLTEALEYYYQALLLNPDQGAWVNVSIAATLLQAEADREARLALKRCGHLQANDQLRFRVVKAELFRRQKAQEGLLDSLVQLEGHLHNPVLAEELSVFPELQPFMPEAVSLSHPRVGQHKTITVQVQDKVGWSVEVNGQPLPVRAGDASAELLLSLLNHAGKLTTLAAIQQFWPAQANGSLEQAMHALKARARRLRTLLGWPDSVTLRGQNIWLDQYAEWQLNGQKIHLQPEEF